MRSARIDKAVLKRISPRFGQRAARCGAACNGLQHGNHRCCDGPSQRHDDRTRSVLLQILEDSLPLEAKGRVRSVTLLPLNVVVQCCKTLGRGPRTTALLTALAEPVPRLWDLEAQREADAANLEYDPLLADDIAALEAKQ